jgi:AraC-like DNA-binding protein
MEADGQRGGEFDPVVERADLTIDLLTPFVALAEHGHYIAGAGPRDRRRDRLPPAGDLDGLVRAAAIKAATPRTAVERLAFDLGLGERQLRRRFDGAVGYGPKTLQRVLRFQRFLALARDAGATADLADLAFAAGYADQAHLTRECRRLAGLPPAALLATGAGPAGDRSVALAPAGAPDALAA